MESVITIDARPVVNEVTRLLGETFSFDALMQRVAQWREQPIHFIEDNPQPGTDGYCVPLSDCDVIATRPGLNFDRKQTVQLHEVAHILSGHVPFCKGHPDAPTYREFIAQPELRKHYVVCRGRNDVINAYQERVIETIAALLQECIIRHETEIPTIVKDMYGY